MNAHAETTNDAAVVAIGEQARIDGFGLAGARVVVADSPAQIRDAWAASAGASLVVLTTVAAEAVGGSRFEPGAPPCVVMPP